MNKAMILLGFVSMLGTAAQALENPLSVEADQGVGSIRRAPETGAQNAGMQAVCREVFVDADEGYGVTRRETRVVCNDAR